MLQPCLFFDCRRGDAGMSLFLPLMLLAANAVDADVLRATCQYGARYRCAAVLR